MSVCVESVSLFSDLHNICGMVGHTTTKLIAITRHKVHLRQRNFQGHGMKSQGQTATAMEIVRTKLL